MWLYKPFIAAYVAGTLTEANVIKDQRSEQKNQKKLDKFQNKKANPNKILPAKINKWNRKAEKEVLARDSDWDFCKATIEKFNKNREDAGLDPVNFEEAVNMAGYGKCLKYQNSFDFNICRCKNGPTVRGADCPDNNAVGNGNDNPQDFCLECNTGYILNITTNQCDRDPEYRPPTIEKGPLSEDHYPANGILAGTGCGNKYAQKTIDQYLASEPGLYNAREEFVQSFDTCGVSGRKGPTLDDCRQAGFDNIDMDEENYPGIQIYEIPEDGNYKFMLRGATGGDCQTITGMFGNFQNSPKQGTNAGAGALVEFDQYFEAGTILRFAIGQHGTGPTSPGTNNDEIKNCGGGGATWILDRKGRLIAVAGGGGGSGTADSRTYAGNDGRDNHGMATTKGGLYGGGQSGSGGNQGTNTYFGAGGAGWLTSGLLDGGTFFGGNSYNAPNPGNFPLEGGTRDYLAHPQHENFVKARGVGGFGGGGSGGARFQPSAGGGGGGYSGGGGGGQVGTFGYKEGTGGGSYVNQDAVNACTRAGGVNGNNVRVTEQHGFISIWKI